MIKRILVGLCGTPYSSYVISRAIELAREHDAELTGVTVIDAARLSRIGPVPTGASASARELREFRFEVVQEHVSAATDEFIAACHAAGIEHQVRQEEGEPFELMASCARYHDLAVVSLRSLFEHGVVPEPHHVLERLVAGGVRPLLAVSGDSRPIRRVLMAYSGSVESANTIKLYVQLGVWRQATVRVISFEHHADVAEQLVADAADYLRQHGFNPEEAYSPESASRHLLPYAADWKADLIVAGNSAKNLILRRMLGETALQLMASSDRPLFLGQ